MCRVRPLSLTLLCELCIACACVYVCVRVHTCGRAHIKVHVATGTVDVCGSEPWAALPYIMHWTEEGAGLGIDVMMKEAYGHATGSCGDLWGNASMHEMNRCNGGWRARQPGLLRSHPMLFAPTQNMPSPGALGAARKLRTHAYAGVLSEGTIANNFYV